MHRLTLRTKETRTSSRGSAKIAWTMHGTLLRLAGHPAPRTCPCRCPCRGGWESWWRRSGRSLPGTRCSRCAPRSCRSAAGPSASPRCCSRKGNRRTALPPARSRIMYGRRHAFRLLRWEQGSSEEIASLGHRHLESKL